MSGRKRPYIQPWEIEIEAQNREVRRLQSRLQDAQVGNRQLSAELSRVDEKIRAIGNRLEQDHKRIEQIDRDMSDLKQKDENSREYADQWLKLIREQQQLLIDLAMDRFFKQQYGVYAEHIENIADDIRDQQYQAAIALAQNWHTSMKHDLPEIERHFREGIALEMELEDSFEQLTEMMNQNTIELQFDSDNGRVTESLDISYWANEEWSQATNAFKELRNRMKMIRKTDLGGMKEMDKSLNQVVDLINFAGRKTEIRVKNYRRKMVMQANIARKMVDRGFEISDNIFEGDDKRGKNILLMENERGEKILINIGESRDQLDMEVGFSTLDPLTHGQRLDAIMATIGSKQVQTVQGYEHKPAEEELFDLKRYKRAQTP